MALAVLVVELLAGMQIYLNQTVLPLLATEMGARNAYGLVTAAAQVPAFLTMPLGGAMLARWRPNRLMTALTAAFAVVSQPFALRRALSLGVSKEAYLRRQRIWAAVSVIVGAVALIVATYYNLFLNPALAGLVS